MILSQRLLHLSVLAHLEPLQHLQVLFLVDLHVPLGVRDVRVPEHHLRRFDVLGLFVEVGSLGGPEVVALDCLAVFLKEVREPLEQGVAGSNSAIRGEYHSVMRRILLLPERLHRIHHFWLPQNPNPDRRKVVEVK